MGAFSQEIRSLYNEAKEVVDCLDFAKYDTILVDTSVVLHYIYDTYPDLAFDIATCNNYDDNLVSRLVQLLLTGSKIHQSHLKKTIFVWEPQGIVRRQPLSLVRKLTRKISKIDDGAGKVTFSFGNHTDEPKPETKKWVSRYFGRPDDRLSLLMCRKLVDMGLQSQLKSDPADYQISSIVNKQDEAKKILIVSNDSDYGLLMCHGKSQVDIYDPKPILQSIITSHALDNVRKELGLDGKQMAILFLACGSDNWKYRRRGLPLRRALLHVKEGGFTKTPDHWVLDFLFDKEEENPRSILLSVLSSFGWSTDVVRREADFSLYASTGNMSMLDKFAEKFCRPQEKQKKKMKKYCSMPDLSKTSKSKVLRTRAMEHTKERILGFNIFSLLEDQSEVSKSSPVSISPIEKHRLKDSQRKGKERQEGFDQREKKRKTYAAQVIETGKTEKGKRAKGKEKIEDLGELHRFAEVTRPLGKLFDVINPKFKRDELLTHFRMCCGVLDEIENLMRINLMKAIKRKMVEKAEPKKQEKQETKAKQKPIAIKDWMEREMVKEIACDRKDVYYSLYDQTILKLLANRIHGNVLTIAHQRFPGVLEAYVAETPVMLNFPIKLSFLLARFVVKMCLLDEKTMKNDEQSHFFKMRDDIQLREKTFKYWRRKVTLSSLQEQQLDRFIKGGFSDLIKSCVPEMLWAPIGDQSAGWWDTLSKTHLFEIVSFMESRNELCFIQHNLPTPNTRARYHNFCPTVLSHIIRSFQNTTVYKTRGWNEIIVKELNSFKDEELQKFKQSIIHGNQLRTDQDMWRRSEVNLSHDKPTAGPLLWLLFFPGIKEKLARMPHLHFLHNFQSDGYSIHVQCANHRLTTASSSPTGFSTQSYHGLVAEDERLSLEALTVKREIGGGRSSLKGSHPGMLNLEYAFKNVLRYGKEEASKVLEEHIIVCLDPGEVLEVAGIAVIANLDANGNLAAKWVPLKLNSKEKQRVLHVEEDLTNECLVEMAHLSIHHSRTNKSSKIDQWLDTLKGCTNLKAHSHCEPVLGKKLLKKSKMRSYLDTSVNMILAAVDRLTANEKKSMKSPLIVFGDATKSRYGRTIAGSKLLRDHLARFFPVLIVNEYHTSKVCPWCLGPIKKVDKAPRSLHCGRCAKMWNRDVGAGLVFFKIFVSSLAFGIRPTSLRRPWDPGQK